MAMSSSSSATTPSLQPGWLHEHLEAHRIWWLRTGRGRPRIHRRFRPGEQSFSSLDQRVRGSVRLRLDRRSDRSALQLLLHLEHFAPARGSSTISVGSAKIFRRPHGRTSSSPTAQSKYGLSASDTTRRARTIHHHRMRVAHFCRSGSGSRDGPAAIFCRSPPGTRGISRGSLRGPDVGPRPGSKRPFLRAWIAYGRGHPWFDGRSRLSSVARWTLPRGSGRRSRRCHD